MKPAPVIEFESILQRVEASEHAPEAEEVVGHGPIISGPWFIAETIGRGFGPASYETIELVPGDEPLPSTDPDAIARELDLGSCADAAALAKARRRFAAHNHPDRFAGERRAIATKRMTIANSLIDAEIRRRVFTDVA